MNEYVRLGAVLELANELISKRDRWMQGAIGYAEMFTTMRKLLSVLEPYVKSELEAADDLAYFNGDIQGN